jgi:predicted nucleotidyltransferase
MEDLISELKEKIEPIARKFNLKLVVLFGSVARGIMRSDSDIDMAVVSDSSIFEVPELYRDFMEALEPIENHYGKDIDLVQIDSVNIILLKRILIEGVLLYEYEWQYYNIQRLHWRFLVEDNYRFTLNYSDILQRKLEML